MSIESNSDGETPEVEPAKADQGAVDSDVTAVADGTQSVAASACDERPALDEASQDAESPAEAVGESPAGASETLDAKPVPAAAEDTAAAADDTAAAEDQTAAAAAADDTAKPKAVRKRRKAKVKLDEDPDMDVEPLELVEEESAGEAAEKHWYILKVQVNREGTIRDALERRVKIEGLEPYVDEIIVPTEDIAEFTKTGKRKITKRKLYPGYIMVNMVINDDTWFAVRETPGIGDFTGSAGKPTPMDPREVERILRRDVDEDEETQVKTSIPFSLGDHVRVKEGNFQNFEGDVDKIDEAHGLITVVINIFNRPTPVEIQYWQIEKV